MKTFKEKSDFCCEPFYRSLRKYEWHRFKEVYLMPVIPQTSLRVNFCFSCGEEVRSINVHQDLF